MNKKTYRTWVTKTEYSKYWGISRTAVYKALKSGRLIQNRQGLVPLQMCCVSLKGFYYKQMFQRNKKVINNRLKNVFQSNHII